MTETFNPEDAANVATRCFESFSAAMRRQAAALGPIADEMMKFVAAVRGLDVSLKKLDDRRAYAARIRRWHERNARRTGRR